MYEHKILYTKHYLKIPICTAVEVFCGSKDFLLKSIRPYYDLKEVRQTKVACKTSFNTKTRKYLDLIEN